MLLSSLLFLVFLAIFGNICCTNDVSNPTPVYVVQGGEAVLQSGFRSDDLSWNTFKDDNFNNIIASAADTIDSSKYSTSTYLSTELYYRLHILNVEVSDVKKYRCDGIINGVLQMFYLQLVLIVPPSSLRIENATPQSRLLGTEGQDLTVSCKAEGGTPAHNVVLIIDGQSVANQTQSAHHTLIAINRSYDHKTFTCQASFADYSQNTMTDSAMIYLNLRPFPPTITGYVGSIEETKPLVVTYTTTGSRPKATLQWTVGQKDVTSDATERSSHITASDTYTVISHLTYSVGKSDNGHVLTCKAVNVAVSSGVQTSLTLNVAYAPTVTVNGVTYDQNEAIRTVTCVPVGNPSTYTYYEWQHKYKYGVLIRELNGGQNGVLTLPSITVEDRYHDSGEYVCSAGIDIVGSDGNVEQTGSGDVTINAQPVFTNDNILTQYGEFGKNVDINVYVYSIPKYTTSRWYRAQPIFTNDNRLTQYGEFGNNVDINVYVYSIPKYTTKQWYRGNTTVSSSTKYVMSERLAIVNDTFHGKDVQLDVYSVMLTIKRLKESDFNVSYRLQLSYGVNQTVQYSVLLESAIQPQTPANFSLVSSTETSILVEWTPGYTDDHEQTFYLEYRACRTETWSLKRISYNAKQLTSLTYVLSGLQDSTLYALKMYSKNMFGRSLSTDIDIIQTSEKQEKVIQDTSSSGFYAVIGGMAGVMTVLIIIVIILGTLLFRIKKDWSGGKRNKISNRSDNIDEMSSPNRTTNDMYEDIREGTSGTKNEDLQQRGGNVSTTTYEMLGMQDIPNTYGDLSSEQEQRQSESTTEQHETLGEQDKPNVYEQIKNKQEPEDRGYTNLKI